MTVLLFTAKYPYNVGAEQSFLEVEINYLAQVFERVVLLPRNTEGERLALPAGVEVDDSYAYALNHADKLQAALAVLGAPCLYQEVLAHPSILVFPSAFKRVVEYIGGAFLTSQWVEQWLVRNSHSLNGNLLFYTYWFDQATMGIGSIKRRHPDVRLVTRAHGYDIYEEYYYRPAFWPCRLKALSLVDRLFADSKAGERYLRQKYPQYAGNYETSLQGVSDPGFLNIPSRDGVFRIVSCSMIRAEKRVELLFEGFKCAAKLRPEQRFEWYHIGNGESRHSLQELADGTLPQNARAYLPGYQDKNTLYQFYRETPLDMFMNVSATEGTPVSIMEAISCGLPVIATSVGGNQEIVSGENGILLPEAPGPEEIARTILDCIDHPGRKREMREASRRVWEQQYDADRNFSVFANTLKKISEAN